MTLTDRQEEIIRESLELYLSRELIDEIMTEIYMTLMAAERIKEDGDENLA